MSRTRRLPRQTREDGQTTLEWMGISAIVVGLVASLLLSSGATGEAVVTTWERLLCEAVGGDCGSRPEVADRRFEDGDTPIDAPGTPLVPLAGQGQGSLEVKSLAPVSTPDGGSGWPGNVAGVGTGRQALELDGAPPTVTQVPGTALVPVLDAPANERAPLAAHRIIDGAVRRIRVTVVVDPIDADDWIPSCTESPEAVATCWIQGIGPNRNYRDLYRPLDEICGVSVRGVDEEAAAAATAIEEVEVTSSGAVAISGTVDGVEYPVLMTGWVEDLFRRLGPQRAALAVHAVQADVRELEQTARADLSRAASLGGAPTPAQVALLVDLQRAAAALAADAEARLEDYESVLEELRDLDARTDTDPQAAARAAELRAVTCTEPTAANGGLTVGAAAVIIDEDGNQRSILIPQAVLDELESPEFRDEVETCAASDAALEACMAETQVALDEFREAFEALLEEAAALVRAIEEVCPRWQPALPAGTGHGRNLIDDDIEAGGNPPPSPPTSSEDEGTDVVEAIVPEGIDPVDRGFINQLARRLNIPPSEAAFLVYSVLATIAFQMVTAPVRPALAEAGKALPGSDFGWTIGLFIPAAMVLGGGWEAWVRVKDAQHAENQRQSDQRAAEAQREQDRRETDARIASAVQQATANSNAQMARMQRQLEQQGRELEGMRARLGAPESQSESARTNVCNSAGAALTSGLPGSSGSSVPTTRPDEPTRSVPPPPPPPAGSGAPGDEGEL